MTIEITSREIKSTHIRYGFEFSSKLKIYKQKFPKF